MNQKILNNGPRAQIQFKRESALQENQKLNKLGETATRPTSIAPLQNQTMQNRNIIMPSAWKSYVNLALIITSVAAFTAGAALSAPLLSPILIGAGIIALAFPFTVMLFIGRPTTFV